MALPVQSGTTSASALTLYLSASWYGSLIFCIEIAMDCIAPGRTATRIHNRGTSRRRPSRSLHPTRYGDDSLLKQSTWASRAYPQVQVSMYVLWHLCVRPEGPNVDRAWEVIQTMFSRDLCDGSTIGAGSMGAVLIALKAKATSIREKLQASSRRNPQKEFSGG